MKLLSCPFCGKEMAIHYGSEKWTASCTNKEKCGITFVCHDGNCTDKFNHRTPPTLSRMQRAMIAAHGWKLVPVKATRSMLQAATNALEQERQRLGLTYRHFTPYEKHQLRYEAMLARAPTAANLGRIEEEEMSDVEPEDGLL